MPGSTPSRFTHALAVLVLVLVAVAVALAPRPALGADEAFLDRKTHEALYLSDGPKVAYRGSRDGTPQPLILVGTEDGGRIIKVRFKKSPQVWTLTLAVDRKSLTCEAKGAPLQTFELLTPASPEEVEIQRRFGGRNPPEVILTFTNGIDQVSYSIRRSDLAIVQLGPEFLSVGERHALENAGAWLSVAAKTGAGPSLPQERRPRFRPFTDPASAGWAELADGTLIWIERMDPPSGGPLAVPKLAWAVAALRGKLVNSEYVEIVLEGD